MRVAVVIVAAGRGHRMAGATPKQYLSLAGTPILRRTVQAMLACAEVTSLRVVIHPDDRGLYDAAMAGVTDRRVGAAVEGGATRATSVANGLHALATDSPDAVLIHDAARPFCSAQIVTQIVAALAEYDGAFAALPVVDALWSVDHREAQLPISREGLWRAQTPQGFRYAAIVAAHEAADADAADDVTVARAAGLSVAVVPGDEMNFKITFAADMARAEQIVAQNPSI